MSYKFSEEEIDNFKLMFCRYCRKMTGDGRCKDGDCEFCAVNKAYDTIFDNLGNNDEDECEERINWEFTQKLRDKWNNPDLPLRIFEAMDVDDSMYYFFRGRTIERSDIYDTPEECYEAADDYLQWQESGLFDD